LPGKHLEYDRRWWRNRQTAVGWGLHGRQETTICNLKVSQAG